MYPVASCRNRNWGTGVQVITQTRSIEGYTEVTESALLSNGVGDTFDSYRPQDPIVDTLDSDIGWSAPWVHSNRYLGIQAVETFDTYVPGSPINLDGGSGWNGPWVVGDRVFNVRVSETFDTYSSGNVY